MQEMLSLVDYKAIEKDPRNLPYLYPSMTIYHYKQRTEKYYRNVSLKAFEEVAQLEGKIVVPASCLHWERKKRMADQKVTLLGKTYYVMYLDDMTDLEYKKYELFCLGGKKEDE